MPGSKRVGQKEVLQIRPSLPVNLQQSYFTHMFSGETGYIMPGKFAGLFSW